MLAQYDSEEGFSFGKNKKIEFNQDTINFLNDEKLNNTSIILDEISSKYTDVDQNAVKFVQTMRTEGKQLQQGQTYLQAYESQLKSTGLSFKNIGASAKNFFGSLGAGAINALGGMAIGALVSGGMSLISKGIDKLIVTKKERQEELQEMASKAEEAKSNIESLTSSMRDNAKTVNDVKDRYAELSQGVDNLSNKNISLSTSEYEEFLDLTNQLSEVFPQLNRGIDDNGNAILDLNGDVNTITSSLESLIQVEKELANQKIAENASEYIKNTIPQLETNYKELNEMKDLYNREKSLLSNYIDVNSIGYSVGGKIDVDTLFHYDPTTRDNIISQLKEMGIDKQWETVYSNDKYHNIIGYKIEFTDEDKNAIEKFYAKFITTTETEIKKSEAELARANQQLSAMASYWYTSELSLKDQSGKAIYDNLQSADLQNGIQQMLNDINWAELSIAGEWDSEQDVYDYISKNILIPLDNASPEIRDSVYNNIIKAFTDTTLSSNEKLELLKNLQQQLSDLGITVDLSFKIKELETDRDVIKNQLGFNKNASSAYDAQRNQDINEFVNSLSDNDKTLWLNAEIPDSVKNGTKEEWCDFLNELKKDASIKIETKLDPVKPLSEMKSAFSQFESIYEDIHNSTFVASDAIESLNDAFGDLELGDGTKALQEFKDILTTMPDDIDAQQAALNKLATVYLDNSDLLKNLNEENKEYTIRQLEAIGVINAREVVESRLNQTEEDLAKTEEALSKSQNILNIVSDIVASKQANVADETERAAIAKRASEIASIDLENATIDEIAQLITEAKNADIDTTALGNLAASKIASNKSVITTDGDVKNLADLADQLTGTNTNAALYAKMMDYISKGWYPAAAALESQIRQNSIAAQLNAGKHKNTVISYAAPSSNNFDSGGGSGGDSEEAFEETIDWIETKIQRITSFIQDIKKSADNTYDDWSLRNTELANEISFVNEELQIQYKAYKRYMKEANSIDLSETYKEKVRGGKIDIETITDEDLKSKIDLYKQWYEKALSASDAIHDLHINLSELAEQKFNNVKSEYEGLISLIESSSSLIESKLSNIEARGYFANSKYYENLRKFEQEKYSDLYKEYDALTKKFNEAISTGMVEENSEAWINMKNEISNVEKSLIDCNTQIVDLNKNIRDLNWEKFDYAEERIGKITEEANFLIDLLDRDSLYEDNGKFNNKGMATLGLRGINYNTYMQQSRNYANELIKIERDLADNPYNKELIARREELLELQQDAISNSESEKDAIKSLVQEGINLHLESLSNIIDKYKESLSAAKDLYDYQKNLTDQTKEIASLEKIMMAYSGDDSEGTRKIVQETKLKLEEAKTNLQETQWDRYISDTEKLLDDLYNDYSEVLNEVLNDTNNLIKNVIGDINSNSKDIQSAINSVSKDVGYTLSDNFNKAINGKKDIASVYIDGISKTTTNIYNVINQILNFVSSMSTKMNGWLKNTDGSWSYMNNGFETKNGWINSNNKWYHFDENGIMESNKWIKNNNGKWSYVDENGESVSGWKQIKYKGQNTWFNFDKNGYLKTDTWIGNYFVDKNGAMKTNTWIGHNGKYYWVGKDGKWQDLPGWYKDKKPNDGYPLYEYAKGSKYIGKDQWAWTQEEGTEIIYRTKDGAMLTPLGQGDKVYTKDMSDVLWNFAKANVGNSFSTIRSIPNIQKSDVGSIVNNDNAISITLPNVKNYSEFKRDLQNDSKFQSFVQDITVGQMFGKGKLNKNKYM